MNILALLVVLVLCAGPTVIYAVVTSRHKGEPLLKK